MATKGTTIGLNADKIGDMQTALNNYIEHVNTNIRIAAKRENIQKAIKGSASEDSLIAMNKQIDNQLETLTKQLDQFSSIFTEMKEAYTKNDTSNTSFTSVTSNIK